MGGCKGKATRFKDSSEKYRGNSPLKAKIKDQLTERVKLVRLGNWVTYREHLLLDSFGGWHL